MKIFNFGKKKKKVGITTESLAYAYLGCFIEDLSRDQLIDVVVFLLDEMKKNDSLWHKFFYMTNSQGIRWTEHGELPVIRTLRGIDINVLGKDFLIKEIQKELKARPAIDMGLGNEMLQKCSNVTLFDLLGLILKMPLGDK